MRIKISDGQAVAPVVPGRVKIKQGTALQVSSTPAGPEQRTVKPEAESDGDILGGPPSLAAPEQPAGVGSAIPPLVNAFWSGDRVVGVTEEGKFKHVPARFSFYVRRTDLDLEQCRRLRAPHDVLGMTSQGDWWRVDTRDYESRKKLVSALHLGWLRDVAREPSKRTFKDAPHIATFEGDLNPVRRFMLDNEPLIATPRPAFIDLETDSRVPFSRAEKEARILCFSMFDMQRKLVARHVLEDDTDRAEHALLVAMWQAAMHFDQLIAWNGDRFDFPVIVQRTKDRGLRLPIKRWLMLDHMELFRRMNIMAAESGEEKSSFSLNAICKAVLGEDEGKLDFDASQTWQEWEAGGARRQRMMDYCDHDTELMPKLEAETGYIALLNTLCEVTGTFPDTRGIAPQQQVESFLMRLAKRRGVKPATRVASYEEREHLPPGQYAANMAAAQFRGAFVMQPKVKGFARNVHVCDFASLYPSIILTWNMSFETVAEPVVDPNDARPQYLPRVEWKREEHIPEGCALAPITDILFVQSVVGMLPESIESALKLRKYWTDKKAAAVPGTDEWKDADRRATAYKIFNNSFYGVAGAQTSRFYRREVAESVAQAGVWLIKQTIEQAEARGMKVVYGDTDSCFVQGVNEPGFGAFVEWCNKSFYPEVLRQRGCTRNHIKLAYEKEFAWVVFVTAKRYVGKYEHYKGTRATADSKPEVRGLEYKRGDTMRLARNFQKQIIDLMMEHEDRDVQPYIDAVLAQREFILTGELPFEDFVISKRLSQSLKSYKVRIKKDGTQAAGQPHVAIGHILQARGRDMGEGAKVEYVCIDGSTSPKKYIPAEDYGVQLADKEGNLHPGPLVDRHEIWESLVYPPTQRLLEAAFPNTKWEQWERTRPAKVRGRKAADEHTLLLPGFEK
jgi:DNA polymerase elongation subunit (family B)